VFLEILSTRAISEIDIFSARRNRRMVDAFGYAAGTLANELIPQSGGTLSRATDPAAFPQRLAGILPPQG
jgi:hypothetical protein